MLYYIGRTLVAQWNTFRGQPLETQLAWPAILASAAIVLVSYAILVQTWRVMLRGWDRDVTPSLSFTSAARIWCISNLGRYVPGKVWQILTMGLMAQRAGLSPVASAGSALLSTLVNIASGVAITLALGWTWLDRISAEARVVAVLLVAGAGVGLGLLPLVLPRLSAIVSQLTGREAWLGNPPTRVVVAAIVGNLAAWTLYGLAFMWLVRGLLGDAPGPVTQYIAVFAASYVVGYLFLFLPGGIGPREGVMVVLLTALQLTTYKQALLVAGASRIWLTILEIVPGALFWATDAMKRPPSTQAPLPP